MPTIDDLNKLRPKNYKIKCPKCKILFELFDQVPQTKRNYWLMTELFVMIHDGKDVCNFVNNNGNNHVKDR